MRISTVQAFNNGVSGLQRNYSNVIRTQEQISTGNRILTPADDPVASARLLQLEQQQGVLGQYKENLTAAKNSQQQEEVTLNSINTVLLRVRDLLVEAGNGSRSQADRQSIAAELAEREKELLGLMNTRNARGEFIFSGFQGKTQPFVVQPDGSYIYAGDDGQRELQIASSLQIPISDSGRALFESGRNAARLGIAPDNGTLSGALVDDEVSFARFPAGGIRLEFNDPDDPRIYELIPVDEFGADGTPIPGRLNEDEDTLVRYQGVAFHVNGIPDPASLPMAYAVTPPDNDPATAPANKAGILATIASVRQALEEAPDNLEGNRHMRDAVALGLTNLNNGMTVLDQGRGQIGARLNVIESTMTDNEDVTLVNKSVQAELRELDYAEALSRLSFQSIILEAAQQSYVKIAGLSLFNSM